MMIISRAVTGNTCTCRQILAKYIYSFIVQSVLRYSFALRSDTLWSSCFESYGPKDTR